MSPSPFDLLERAEASFRRPLAAAVGRAAAPRGSDIWSRASGCGTWTVGQLVSHVVGATTMYVALLDGAEAGDVIAMMMDADVGWEQAEDGFVAAAHTMKSKLREPHGRARVVHHPAGDITGQELLGYALVEWTVHGWDLAVALHTDYEVAPDLAKVTLTQMAPIAGRLSALGAFRPAQPPPADADAWVRLLVLLGRDPARRSAPDS